MLSITSSILTIWIIKYKTFHLTSKKNNKIDSVTYTKAYEEHDNPGYAEIAPKKNVPALPQVSTSTALTISHQLPQPIVSPNKHPQSSVHNIQKVDCEI